MPSKVTHRHLDLLTCRHGLALMAAGKPPDFYHEYVTRISSHGKPKWRRTAKARLQRRKKLVEDIRRLTKALSFGWVGSATRYSPDLPPGGMPVLYEALDLATAFKQMWGLDSFGSLVRKLMPIEVLPPGALPVYDKEIDLDRLEARK